MLNGALKLSQEDLFFFRTRVTVARKIKNIKMQLQFLLDVANMTDRTQLRLSQYHYFYIYSKHVYVGT